MAENHETVKFWGTRGNVNLLNRRIMARPMRELNGRQDTLEGIARSTGSFSILRPFGVHQPILHIVQGLHDQGHQRIEVKGTQGSIVDSVRFWHEQFGLGLITVTKEPLVFNDLVNHKLENMNDVAEDLGRIKLVCHSPVVSIMI